MPIKPNRPLLSLLFLLGSLPSLLSQLTIPSDGSDGAFSPSANIEVDLSQAITGTRSDNNTANSGKGIYDSTKWAIVFKYSSINIPAGVTVTFKNHPTHAPVVWLVQDAVNIAGIVNVNGKPGVGGPIAATPPEPGPGGFRGGTYGAAGSGGGYGPGGGGNNGHGVYASSYGNPQILPLIGGSGAGSNPNNGFSGDGGGGAILIATPSTIGLNETITAKSGSNQGARTGGSGAIKLIANAVTGTGNLDASNVFGATFVGRIRIETNSLSPTITTAPSTIAVAPGTTPTIFQSNTSPTVRVVSVDGVNAPIDSTAPLGTSADVAIQKNTAVTIVLVTRNFATAGAVVSVRIQPKFGETTSLNATLDPGGSTTLSTWRVNATLPPGFVTLQARATGP